MAVYKVALVQKETIPNNLEENQKRMCCWIEEAEKKGNCAGVFTPTQFEIIFVLPKLLK